MNKTIILDIENLAERQARLDKEFLEEQLESIDKRTQELIEGISKIRHRIYKIKNELKTVAEKEFED